MLIVKVVPDASPVGSTPIADFAMEVNQALDAKPDTRLREVRVIKRSGGVILLAIIDKAPLFYHGLLGTAPGYAPEQEKPLAEVVGELHKQGLRDRGEQTTHYRPDSASALPAKLGVEVSNPPPRGGMF